jgi:hypothetical protein
VADIVGRTWMADRNAIRRIRLTFYRPRPAEALLTTKDAKEKRRPVSSVTLFAWLTLVSFAANRWFLFDLLLLGVNGQACRA